MKKIISTCMVFFSLLFLPAGAVADIDIHFDFAGAPILFSATSPLTDLYKSSWGVTFSGPASGEGGAILAYSSNFGVPTHSGSNFLAFNVGTYAKDPEAISFDTLWQTVSIYVSGGANDATFRMDYYDGWDKFVGFQTVTADPGAWALLSVNYVGGIGRVVLTESDGDGSFVFDDLSTSGAVAHVPEPASLILLLAGIAGLAGVRPGRRN